MTKRREPLTFHRALTEIAGRIGWDKCAMLVGRTERLVRLWSDPDADSEISIIDALRLDKAFLASGGEHAPFLRVFTMQLEIASSEVDIDVTLAAAKAAKEGGEAVAALIAAATRPTDIEARRRAYHEAEEAVDALTDGIAALKRQEQGS